MTVDHRGAMRKAWEWLTELVGEFVGDAVIEVISCILLAGAVLGLVRGWGRSPELTLGAVAVLVLGSAAVITAWRHPGRLRARRLGGTLGAMILALALWFVLYGVACDCL